MNSLRHNVSGHALEKKVTPCPMLLQSKEFSRLLFALLSFLFRSLTSLPDIRILGFVKKQALNRNRLPCRVRILTRQTFNKTFSNNVITKSSASSSVTENSLCGKSFENFNMSLKICARATMPK